MAKVVLNKLCLIIVYFDPHPSLPCVFSDLRHRSLSYQTNSSTTFFLIELIALQLGPKKTKIPRRQLSKLSISHIHFLSIMAKTILQASFFSFSFFIFYLLLFFFMCVYFKHREL